MFPIPDNWNEISLKERQAARFQAWASPELESTNPKAEQGYKRHTQMIMDVVQLKRPERVPVISWWGTFPAHYAIVTIETLMLFHVLNLLPLRKLKLMGSFWNQVF